MDLTIDPEIPALKTYIMQWIFTKGKKAFVQRVVFKGASLTKKKSKGRKKSNNIIVFSSLVVFNSESGAKVQLKFNRRLDIEK